MRGATPDIDVFYGISELRGRVAGITEGLRYLRRGDVFIYEMQTDGPGGDYVPADYERAVWDITKTATDAGIIVIAAGGNGGRNLDAPAFSAYRNRGDNGSIRVGAGTATGRNRAGFSSFGSPIHVQGWGDWNVASTGYGDLFNAQPRPTRSYTATYSGTSAATPVAAAVAIAAQSYFRATRPGMGALPPAVMRSLLISSGTPQGTGGHIGPLPNIRNIITAINRDPSSHAS